MPGSIDGSVDGEYGVRAWDLVSIACLGARAEYLTSLSIDTKMIFEPIEAPQSIAQTSPCRRTSPGLVPRYLGARSLCKLFYHACRNRILRQIAMLGSLLNILNSRPVYVFGVLLGGCGRRV
jgi:hypothetical protein